MQPTIFVPQDVRYLIHRLQQAGHRAYAVGGCVRDTILHKTPDDWDICTSARPEQTLAALDLPNIIENGLKHGTVTVRYHDTNYEITTFRTDGVYADHRRPSSVTFVQNVREDLRRRDFTVNALAYNEEEGLIDYFGGIEDIENRVLRCVGDPDERFQEDGLRIMRALRFASRDGFQIEEQTAAALRRNAHLLKNIAMERITTEFNKLLTGDHVEPILTAFASVLAVVIPEIQPMIGFEQHNPHHALDVWQHTVKAVVGVPPEKRLRLAAFLHDIGKPSTFTRDEQGIGHFYGHPSVGEQMTQDILRRMRYDNETIAHVAKLVALHNRHPSLTEKSVRRLLHAVGDRLLPDLLRLQWADAHAKGLPVETETEAYFEQLKALCEKEMHSTTAYTLKMLAVNGNDLMAVGIPKGTQLGRILNALLEDVMEGTLPNEKDVLLSAALELSQGT